MAQVINVLNAAVITATGQSAAVNPAPEGSIANNSELSIEIEVTAASGTSPSVQFSVLWSDDGINWAAAPDNIGAALTAVGNAVATVPVRGALFALAYAVTGTTPSFTVTAQAFV